MSYPDEIIAAIERERGDGWRAELPPNPTPAQECAAFAADANAIHQAHERIKARRRAELAAWHRAALATFASLMIAAGVNAKALSTYMGHANIGTTLDRYGHLMPGNEEEAASLLDSYLTAQQERADERARSAVATT